MAQSGRSSGAPGKGNPGGNRGGNRGGDADTKRAAPSRKTGQQSAGADPHRNKPG
jgi:hypothetical protein